MMQALIRTQAPGATVLIRLMVGGVFLSEGIQKFLWPAFNGARRFAKIGLPYPEFFGPFVGTVEIVFGTLVLLGLFTRLAVLPLIVTMLVAITTTKIPILLGEEFLGFTLRDLKYYGFWSMMHESRTDLSMLLGALFLLLVGAGPLSLDRRISQATS
jgi:uncharacterized membrane protein YphA (DoxX/SURF4 family)